MAGTRRHKGEKLPAAGRRGRAPAWPLTDDAGRRALLAHARREERRLTREVDSPTTDGRTRRRLRRELTATKASVVRLAAEIAARRRAERQLWTSLWHTPQAVMWERQRCEAIVAMYVRNQVIADVRGSLEHSREVRQLANQLGLTPASMVRLGWVIETAPPGRAVTPRPANGPDPRTVLYAV